MCKNATVSCLRATETKAKRTLPSGSIQSSSVTLCERAVTKEAWDVLVGQLGEGSEK